MKCNSPFTSKLESCYLESPLEHRARSKGTRICLDDLAANTGIKHDETMLPCYAKAQGASLDMVSELWFGRWTQTCRGKAEKNKDSCAVLLCGCPLCDSYPQTPLHWSWQGPRVLQGITPIDYRDLWCGLLCWNPVLVFVSMGPVWGWRRVLLVLWIITWESRLWWPVLVSMSMGCKDWRGHPLWNASQVKGSYLLSSRSHHKPWRSCRAFENGSLCPGSFPSTGPGLRNKEGKPSCNAKSLWRSNLPDGNA